MPSDRVGAFAICPQAQNTMHVSLPDGPTPAQGTGQAVWLHSARSSGCTALAPLQNAVMWCEVFRFSTGWPWEIGTASHLRIFLHCMLPMSMCLRLVTV